MFEERNKNTLLTATSVVLLVVAGWMFYSADRLNVSTDRFSGTLIEIKDNTLVLRGGYDSETNPELLRQESAFQAEVTVTEDTEIVMRRVFLPSDEELGEDGLYYAGDLKSENVNITLDDLLGFVDQGVNVTATQDIFGKKKFTAKVIEVVSPVYPDEEN